MTRRTRSAILYVLVAIFFILGGSVVLYAQGWRLKLSPMTLDKVGAIYLRTFPTDTEITIDSKAHQRNVSIFERGILIGNLFPGQHEVVVRKEGYQEWRAHLEVGPSLVTSHARLVLIPATAAVATSTTVADFKIFGETTVVETPSGIFTLDGQALPGKKILAGSDNGAYVITAIPATNEWIWHDLERGTSTPFAKAFPRAIISQKSFASTTIRDIPSTNLFTIAGPASLKLLRRDTGIVTELTSTSTAELAAYASSPTRVAWGEFDRKKNISQISLYDLPSGAILKDIDAIPGKTQKMAFADRGTLVLLQNDGALYSLSTSGGERTKVASEVRYFDLTDDRSRLALVDQEGITILSDQRGGSYRFIRLSDTKTVTEIDWYKDNAHLFLHRNEVVGFLDLTDVAEARPIDVAIASKFWYAAGQNDVYFLKDGKLLRVEFPD